MVWSEAKDYIMLKEVATEGVFDSKPGVEKEAPPGRRLLTNSAQMS